MNYGLDEPPLWEGHLDALKCIIIKLGISYRNISIYNWNNVYKFYIKLINTDLIKKLYVRCKNNYIFEINIDTTFICNKKIFMLK